MFAKLTAFIVLLTGVASASAGSFPAFVKSQHKATLQKFLDQHPYYYIAPESLCDCPDELLQLRKSEPGFEPYYAVGDINDDQIEDFAVALLDKRKVGDGNPGLTIVIFHGPFSKGKPKAGIVVIPDYAVDRPQTVLYVFKSRVEGQFRLPARLDIGPGPFGSDDVHTIIYDKKLKKYSVQYFYDES